MIHHWNSLDLEVTDFEYHHDPTHSVEIKPSRTLNLKHVEVIEVQFITKFETSLERS